MATTKRFVAKNGLDNNNQSITNLGASGSSLTLSGGHAVTLTTSGSSSITVPTSGTLAVQGGALGTPTSLTLTNATGLPVSTGISGLGTGVATFLATPSSTNLASAITDETGSGALVFATSPSLTTPTLGVASATSINKVAITAPATSATLTIADGKTLTASNTLTLTGTDSSSVAFGSGGTVVYTSNKLSVHAATTSAELAGVISDETGSGSLVFSASPTFTGTVNAANLTLSGDLVVNGTTTTVNSTTTTLDDPIITLGGDTAPGADDNKDRGVEYRWHNGTSAKIGFFGYDDSTGKFTFIPDATNTSEVFSGTLGTIDVGAVHISGSQIAASNLSNGTTGSGSIVLATSPSLTTPTLGVASATSINKVAITAPATGSTLTIADGKTLTASNTLTFTGTDSSSVAFGSGGTVAYTANNLGAFATSTSAAIGVGSIELGHASDTTIARSSAGVITVEGVVVPTISSTNTLTNKSLSDSTTFFIDETDGTKKMQLQLSGITTATTRTLTVPNVDGTIVTTGDTGTVTNTMLAGSIATTKLTANTISGVALGNNLNALTIGTGLSGTSYNGSGAVTIAIDSTVATLTGSQTLTNKTLTSPSLTTPSLGVATATSINKVAITAPATGSTLTIADGKTLTASNTLTFTGTDSSSVAFGGGGTVAYTANKLSTFAATTSAELAGVISDETGSGALVFATSPTLVTPALGTPSSGNLTNCTSIPAAQLSGTTINSGVTASSLTSVGTLSSLTVSGNVTVDTNTLFVDSTNNRVAIGTTSPVSTFDVRGTSGQLFSVTDSLTGVVFSVNDISGIPILQATAGTTNYVDVTGEVRATSEITAYYSDERLKTRVDTFEDPMSIVRSLNGFKYVGNEVARNFGYINDNVQVGLSAQEVKNVLPEIVKLAPFDVTVNEQGQPVSRTGENYLTVDYAKLVPVLVEAIKHLEKRIEILEGK